VLLLLLLEHGEALTMEFTLPTQVDAFTVLAAYKKVQFLYHKFVEQYVPSDASPSQDKPAEPLFPILLGDFYFNVQDADTTDSCTHELEAAKCGLIGNAVAQNNTEVIVIMGHAGSGVFDLHSVVSCDPGRNAQCC